MKTRTKLTLCFLACGLIPLVIAAVTSYSSMKNGMSTLTDQAGEDVRHKVTASLQAQRALKQDQIEKYFDGIRDQVLTFSEDRMVVDAMRAFKSSFNSFRDQTDVDSGRLAEMRRELSTYYTGDFSAEYGNQNEGASPGAENFLTQLDDDSVALQHAYIRANSNPLGSKHQLDTAEVESDYGRLHGVVHPVVRSFLEKFGYYDVFLVDDKTGDIVYSVFKELDYTTSLVNGPYAQTNFAEAFRKANALTSPDQFVLVDFEQYTPSYEAPASFIASPIFDGDEKIGVAIFQMPVDRILAVMSQRDGLGETGETILVGADSLMRSDSFRDAEGRSLVTSFRKPTTGKIESDAISAAIKGESGTTQAVDYVGNETLQSYGPVNLLGLRWALVAKMDTAEAFAATSTMEEARSGALNSAFWTNAGVGLLASLAVLALAFFVSKSFEKEKADSEGQIDAISKSQAVIEFNLDGTILTANDNFLNALGYTLDEVQGQHHRMFCETEYTNSADYTAFWAKLGRGEYEAGEFLRLGKAGNEIWIQASYNPIFDTNGKPFKVVKYASDITEQVNQRNEALKLSQLVEKSEGAVMMINRDFVITYANETTVSMLNKYADTFRKVWPSFDPANVMGTCIDAFHKDPSHQRKMLSDPTNLPYKTDIQVGPLTFALLVTAQTDSNGEYVGNALEWKDVTEDRSRVIRETKVAEYQAAEVENLSSVMTEIAKGDLTQNYVVAESDQDTQGTWSTFNEIATQVNAMCSNLREVMTLMTSNAGTLANSSEDLTGTADKLELGASDTMTQSASVSSAAEEMSINMKNMAATTEQMTSNVQSVASSIEEMTASISEIAKNAEQASSVAENASNLAESSNVTIGQLGSAADEIGKVIEVIQDIAEQTNLLALNATIEAARAGDAGKGFAVVATEVKELAKQTADATEDIRSRINGIQGSTQEVVRSIDEISKVISEVNSVSTTIAAAVEEQSVTTKEIARNVSQTSDAAASVSTGVAESASASEEITRSITEVDTAAKSTATAATLTKETGVSLSSLAGELQGLVGKFQV